MTHIKDGHVLIPLFFATFGFLLGYYLRRGLSFILLGIFLYAAFKGLETVKFSPDWSNFDKFIIILQQLGKTLTALVGNMIASAGSLSIMMFLCGGVLGLILTRKEA